jgi:hypothetical protein
VMSPGALMGKLVRHESRKRKNRKEGVQRLQEAVRWCSGEPEIDASAARGLEEQPSLTRPWRATATLNLWSWHSRGLRRPLGGGTSPTFPMTTRGPWII